MDEYHIPVLLEEVLELLQVKSGKKYIDCTLGGGGHTAMLLEKGAIVLAIDQDIEAIENAKANLEYRLKKSELILRHGNFAHLKEIAVGAGFGKVSGILLDLGVSSHQLETYYRGFSFSPRFAGEAGNSPLDMRMDPTTQTVTAADLVNAGGEKELANLFWKFGEEKASRVIAKAIVEFRKTKKIETTNELAEIILKVRRRTEKDRTHPATRVFQALRIAVNDEMDSLEAVLPQAVEILETGGRLAVISFHSLEDRIVKNFMKDNTGSLQIITNKPVEASEQEIENNPRARSGKLRVAQKS